jgi:hypothetical protein
MSTIVSAKKKLEERSLQSGTSKEVNGSVFLVYSVSYATAHTPLP